MNKLYESLLIIRSMGWEQQLLSADKPAFDFLLKKSKNLTNEDLSKEDWAVVTFVEKALKKRELSIKS